MMKIWLSPLVMLLGLGFAGPATAQTGLQKILAPKKNPSPPPAPRQESDSRLIEILVELAWLGDPLTFPFYIEARLEGATLHVRGNVPSRAVRDQALKIAQLNTLLPAADDLKENPRLNVRPTRMSPEQLEKVVRAALRESQPRLAKGLQVRCTADGQVAVLGNVDSFEQKLTISQALRRLHGCTVAINLTRVSYDPEGILARNIVKPTAVPLTINQPISIEVVKGGPLGVPAATQDTGSAATPSITVSVPTPEVSVTPRNNVPSTRLTLPQIQKLIQDACPRAKEVRVTLAAERQPQS